MFFAKIPRHTRQNAITEGDLECILTRNCEGTEQLLFSFLRFFQKCENPFPVPPQDPASGSVDLMFRSRHDDHGSRGQSPSGKFYYKPHLFRF